MSLEKTPKQNVTLVYFQILHGDAEQYYRSHSIPKELFLLCQQSISESIFLILENLNPRVFVVYFNAPLETHFPIRTLTSN